MRTKFWNLIIMIIGAPIIILLSIWSIYGEEILSIPAPKSQEIILVLIGSVAALLLLLLRRESEIDNNINIILAAVDHHSRIHNGKDSSINQVDLMLSEAFQLLKAGKRLEIYEAHLEPKPPSDNGSLPSHLKIIQLAAKNDLNLNWKIIVGHVDSVKTKWIKHLVQEVQEKSNGKYHVFELKNAEPSLNFLVIKQIHQTYFGMGDWLGEKCTGGVWVENQHLTEAMWGILEKLEDTSESR
jgi:hypothetical protein